MQQSQQQWDRQPEEPGGAYRYFTIFLELGPERDLIKTAERAGKTVDYIRKLSSRHSWKSRAQAHDAHHFRMEIQGRREAIEHGRQLFVRAVPKAIRTICLLSEGRTEGGDMQEHYNRKGEHIGQLPIVKPSTRLQAAIQIIERAGITVPKRIELTGQDGREIRIDAARALGKLEDEQLHALLGMLSLADGDEREAN